MIQICNFLLAGVQDLVSAWAHEKPSLIQDRLATSMATAEGETGSHLTTWESGPGEDDSMSD